MITLSSEPRYWDGRVRYVVEVSPGQLRALAAELVEIANDIDEERREREAWKRGAGAEWLKGGSR